MINVYSNNYQSASNYLKDTEVNLHNVLIMAGNFNIRNSDWDFSYPFYLVYNDTLLNIADLFDLKLLCSIQQIPTQCSNNANNTNLDIDLFSLQLNSIKINNYNIFLDLYYPSDYTLLNVDIFINEEVIQDKCHTIIKNS